MNIKSVTVAAVTATVQRVAFPDIRVGYTLTNTGTTNDLYFIYDSAISSNAIYTGNAGVLAGLGMVALGAGRSCYISPGTQYIDVVCATALSTTATAVPVLMLDAIGGGATQTTLAAVLAQGVGLSAALNGGSAVSVTSASATLAAINAARKSLTITNLSLTRALTVQCDGTAVAGAGVVLAVAADANHPGGSVTILGSEYTGIVTGIMNGADATAGNVAVLEV